MLPLVSVQQVGDLTKMADLQVYPGWVALDWVRWGIVPAAKAERLVQQAGALNINQFRFPFWQDTVVNLKDASGSAAAVVLTPGQRKRLVPALEPAGFTVTVRRAGFFLRWAF